MGVGQGAARRAVGLAGLSAGCLPWWMEARRTRTLHLDVTETLRRGHGGRTEEILKTTSLTLPSSSLNPSFPSFPMYPFLPPPLPGFVRSSRVC